MHNVERILDAAANRCREGLRVVEDFVRFVLNDAHLARLLKEHRHELTATLDLLPAAALMTARDTTGDVGTAIQTPAEQQRADAAAVVRANCKRVEESLRTLEEYSKTLSCRVGKTAGSSGDANAAQQFERLRYRFYVIEQAVLQTFRSRERLSNASLYLLVTTRLCTQGLERVVKDAMQGGVDVVQLREKKLSDRELLATANAVREWTTAAGALLIINDRPDVALASGADGVHLGQDDLPVRTTRQFVGSDLLIGVSTHTIQQARQAVLDGADYLGVGPVFPSQTKSFETFPGLHFVSEVAGETSIPWFPLGGINESNIEQVLTAGARRVAVSGAIASADDPSSAASRLVSALSNSLV